MRARPRLVTCATILSAILFALALGMTNASTASGQGPGEAVLFKDDFDSGKADAWQLMGSDGRPAPKQWQVEREPDGNWVLSGTEHTWGMLVRQGNWSDYTYRARVKLLPGSTQGIHLNFRLGQCNRYFIAFHPNGVHLARTQPCNVHTSLTTSPGDHEPDRWYTVEIAGKGNHIRVSVDGVPRIDYTDPTPVLSGGIGIETLDGGHVHIDDLTVFGPAPTPTPTTPPGLSWTFTGGPRGGIGYDVRIHPGNPNVLWVTDANAGVHSSIDGGVTWKSMNAGISARTGFSGDSIPIFSLTIDQNHPDTIWAGTLGMRGVFKTVDGGKTWSQMDNGIEDQPVTEIRAFTVDPRDSNIVYMGGNYSPNPPQLAVRGIIYKTTDGGKTWTKLLEPGALVRWILVDPTNTNTLYASTGIFDRIATKPEGVLKSTDGGRTWFGINEGLANPCVGGLVMHPQNPQVLIATTGKASAFLNDDRELHGAVFKTTDGGQHWRQVYPIGWTTELRYSAAAFAPSNPNILYVDAGNEFLRSDDAGETWTRYVTPSKTENRGQPIALAVHPQNPDWIYMNAYDGGVFRSMDGGKTWVDASAGYSGSQAWDIAADSRNPNYLVVGSKNGVHVSYDGGLTWEGRNADREPNISAVAIDPAAPDRILAANEINGTIYRSTDGGKSWNRVLRDLGQDTALGRISTYQIAFARSQPNTVYAATGIAQMTLGLDRAVKGRGVYRSTNAGETWTPVNQGLEAAGLNILSLAVHPCDPNTVYVGTLDHGVFKTTNGGGAWTLSNQGLPTAVVRALAVDPTNPDILYAGTENAALFKSSNGGRTWQPSSAGLNPEAWISSIAIDPARPQLVYAADRRSGVYRSADGGKTWASINDGLRVRAVNRLALSADGKLLFAGTEGGGVFRIGQPQVPPTSTPTATAMPTRMATATLRAAAVPPSPTPAATLTVPGQAPATPTPIQVTPTSGAGICGGIAAVPLLLAGLVVAWGKPRRKHDECQN